MDYDLVDHIKNTEEKIRLPYDLWIKFDSKYDYVKNISKWKNFKFYNADGSRNSLRSNIPNDKGGIYCFYVSPEIIPTCQRILLYIGEAHITSKQNLRKRVNEYYGYIENKDTSRARVKYMFNKYKKYLYCVYFPLNDNTVIQELEDALIIALLPCVNNDIPDVEISKAVKAAF